MTRGRDVNNGMRAPKQLPSLVAGSRGALRGGQMSASAIPAGGLRIYRRLHRADAEAIRERVRTGVDDIADAVHGRLASLPPEA